MGGNKTMTTNKKVPIPDTDTQPNQTNLNHRSTTMHKKDTQPAITTIRLDAKTNYNPDLMDDSTENGFRNCKVLFFETETESWFDFALGVPALYGTQGLKDELMRIVNWLDTDPSMLLIETPSELRGVLNAIPEENYETGENK